MLSCLFNADSLSYILIFLITAIVGVIGSFAYRYMEGDLLYKPFMIRIAILCFVLILLAVTDNIILFFILWCLSDLILVKLMQHKSEWPESRAAGILAAKTFAVGFICLAVGFGLLWYATDEISIKRILQSSANNEYLVVSSLILIFISAMIQCSIWPFNSWLLSSLNSPTPVSALMHAGLVNGGGILLIRFAPLYFSVPIMLTIIFITGLISAIVGTAWKLIQSDVKRMLACSTLSQMGFMLVQCGLGLFPAALAHLCWHGFFKAYLFLASGSAAQQKRHAITVSVKVVPFIFAFLCGMVGSYFFTLGNHTMWMVPDTTSLLTLITFIALSQIALVGMQKSQKFLPVMIIVCCAIGYIYGASVYFIENASASLNLMRPQPLNLFHYLGMIIFMMLWLVILVRNFIWDGKILKNFSLYLYVKLLNASQPHPSTITANHNNYQYK